MNSLGRLLSAAAICLAYLCAPTAKADSVSIDFTVPQNQTVHVAQTGLTTVNFTGSVVNNTGAPISFTLSGFADPSDFYVASLIFGVPYPGKTLQPGQSTGPIDLVAVNLQSFDPSLSYPGTEKIVLTAIDAIGNSYAEKDTSLTILAPVPEPPSAYYLACGMLYIGVLFLHRKRGRECAALPPG